MTAGISFIPVVDSQFIKEKGHESIPIGHRRAAEADHHNATGIFCSTISPITDTTVKRVPMVSRQPIDTAKMRWTHREGEKVISFPRLSIVGGSVLICDTHINIGSSIGNG